MYYSRNQQEQLHREQPVAPNPDVNSDVLIPLSSLPQLMEQARMLRNGREIQTALPDIIHQVALDEVPTYGPDGRFAFKSDVTKALGSHLQGDPAGEQVLALWNARTYPPTLPDVEAAQSLYGACEALEKIQAAGKSGMITESQLEVGLEQIRGMDGGSGVASALRKSAALAAAQVMDGIYGIEPLVNGATRIAEEQSYGVHADPAKVKSYGDMFVHDGLPIDPEDDDAQNQLGTLRKLNELNRNGSQQVPRRPR